MVGLVLLSIASDHPSDHRHNSLDRWMWIVVLEYDMMEVEIIDRCEAWVDTHAWERTWVASGLFSHLIEVRLVDMYISERMDKTSWLYTKQMREYIDEERV